MVKEVADLVAFIWVWQMSKVDTFVTDLAMSGCRISGNLAAADVDEDGNEVILLHLLVRLSADGVSLKADEIVNVDSAKGVIYFQKLLLIY